MKSVGVDSKTCAGFLIIYLYMYCRWRSSYHDGKIGIQIAGLTPPQAMSVDIGGPAYHPCLSFLCSISYS